MTTRLNVYYEYKIFRAGVYLGSLPNVTSPFNYALDINNSAAPLTVEVTLPAVNANLAPQTLDTEAGVALSTEAGDDIWLESTPAIFGSSTSGRLIANDNDLIVYEFSPDYPSGIKVFSGWISKWQLNVVANKIVIDSISYGMDFNDYLVASSPYTLKMNLDTQTSFAYISGYGTTLQQSFTASSTFSIAKVSLYLQQDVNPSGTAQPYIKLYNQAGVLLATTAPTNVPYTTSYSWYDFTFSSPIALTSGAVYSIVIDNANVENTKVGYASASLFDSGVLYVNNGSGWNPLLAGSGLTARFYSSGGATTAIFTALDPATIFTQALDNYISQGGKATYSGASIVQTGVIVSYTFNTATILDMAKKMVELSPSNFYWTIDPATSLAYFKSFSTTPDILLTLGQNIQDLTLGINAEGVRNALIFTGGPTAGVNLLKQYNNAAGLSATGRQRLATLTDNRVTLSATADQIASAFFGSAASEVYETTVTLYRTTTDLTTLLCGKTVGFGGFGSFIDRLLLYIVRIERHPEYAVLTLGSIPPRASSMLKELQNSVADLETVANPSAPS